MRKNRCLLKKMFFIPVMMVFMVVSFSAVSVQASSIPVADDEQLISGAHSVCIGTVQALNPVWVEDQAGRHIVTEVALQVEESLKGSLPSVINAAYLGGFIDGVGEVAGHAASFKPGERVLVFLNAPNAKGRRHVLEMVQGKFSIISDTATGREVVIRGDGESLKSVDGRISFIKSLSTAPESDQPRDLDEFRQKILNLAGKGE